MDSQSRNHLLNLFDRSNCAMLKPHLKQMTMRRGDILHRPSEAIEFVYFPLSCIVSVLARSEEGYTAETSIVGREGMLGSSVAHGIMTSFIEAVVQIDGEIIRLPSAQFHSAGQASEELRRIVVLFDLTLLAQSQQSTLCQASHQVDSRAARWLLQCRKRIGSDDIQLTQEFFAQMLGVQRTTVTLTEKTLQQAGLIQTGRGRIKIIDVKGLHEVACECYDRIEKRYDELLGPLN
jgi:CRP-like cAMP-binding protein